MWSWTRVEHCLQDMRFGARILRHAPGLSAAAILLIALVIGGNATVYSMVNSILVSPASGVNRDDLVVIRHEDPGVTINDPFVSFPNFEDYARHSTTVSDFAAWNGTAADARHADRQLRAVRRLRHDRTISTPLVWRSRTAAGSSRATMTHRTAWSSSSVTACGRSGSTWPRMSSAGRSPSTAMPATIVGVAPRGFAGAVLTPGEDLWMPIRAYYRSTNAEEGLTNRAQPFVVMAGRLRPSASLAEARSEFATLSAQLQSTYPDAFTTYSPKGVVPLRNPRAVVSRYSATALLPIADMAPVFLAVFSVVTLLTLIVVCANVANLLLGRTVERQRDTAVRQSLGASRSESCACCSPRERRSRSRHGSLRTSLPGGHRERCSASSNHGRGCSPTHGPTGRSRRTG